MSSPLFPAPVSPLIISILTDPDRPAYGQLATVDARGRPQARTVHFRCLDGSLAFAAHTRSPKWAQLTQKPVLAGCLYDPDRSVQLRWEAVAGLVTEKSRGKEQQLRKQIWGLVRPDVRSAYWLKYKRFPVEKLAGSRLDLRRTAWGKKALQWAGDRILKEPCPSFGIVLCLPYRWDVMEIDDKDYRRDTRTIFELKSGRWIPQRVSVIDSNAC